MSDDIVAFLRACANDTLVVEKERLFLLAADEIERLRKERNALKEERDELVRISNKFKYERDEARREVCMADANYLPTMADPRREAKRRGWDCFKENP